MSIYHDTSYKRTSGEKHHYNNRWIAEVQRNGKKIRFYAKNREEAEKWVLQYNPDTIFKKKRYVVPILRHLLPVRTFPGYYVDDIKGLIYSDKGGWPKKLKIRRKMSVNVIHNKKRKIVTVPRIIFSQQHRISYYDIPQNTFVLSWDKGLVIEDKGTFNAKINKKKKESMHADRIVAVQHNMEVMKLLMTAFKGNPLPLVEYVNQKKQYYVSRISSSQQTGEKGYYLALDRLFRYLEFSTTVIYNFDGWFIKTARSLLLSSRSENGKKIQIEKMRSL